MKRTILCAYITLLIAAGLPFLAGPGGQSVPPGGGEANPTPTAAAEEAPPPSPAAAPAPETIAVLMPDGSIAQMDM